jgi:DNA-binding NtrC family response regulator
MSIDADARDEVRGILSAWEVPAAIVGRDYRVVVANPAYLQRFGSEAEGQCCHRVSHGFDVPCHLAGETCPAQQCAASGEPYASVHVDHTALGTERTEIRIWPLHDGRGDIGCYLELLRPLDAAREAPVLERIVGRSPAFERMMSLVRKVAPSQSSVLLRGESGTGKELLALAIHALSPRAGAPFVPVDCSGLAETLFESELFGHEKGSFTSATSSKRGLVEAADGGTLFLDEVGDVPAVLQVKLLRLLETGAYRRVGSTDLRRADFRLVCATHRDLESMVEAGEFREDLYYRIAVVPILLPPLRERREDVPPLVEAMLARIDPGGRLRIHPAALDQILDLPLPGNVRELLNHLERASILADGDLILPRHLPSAADHPEAVARALPAASSPGEIIALEEMERRYIRWSVAVHDGDRRSLAQKLGLSERSLYRKLHDALGDAPGEDVCSD